MKAVTQVPSEQWPCVAPFAPIIIALGRAVAERGFGRPRAPETTTASGRARTCPTGLHENVPGLNLLREVDRRGRREVEAPKGLPKLWSAPEFPRRAQCPASMLRL